MVDFIPYLPYGKARILIYKNFIERTKERTKKKKKKRSWSNKWKPIEQNWMKVSPVEKGKNRTFHFWSEFALAYLSGIKNVKLKPLISSNILRILTWQGATIGNFLAAIMTSVHVLKRFQYESRNLLIGLCRGQIPLCFRGPNRGQLWRRANDRTSAFETLYAIYSLDKTK